MAKIPSRITFLAESKHIGQGERRKSNYKKGFLNNDFFCFVFGTL